MPLPRSCATGPKAFGARRVSRKSPTGSASPDYSAPTVSAGAGSGRWSWRASIRRTSRATFQRWCASRSASRAAAEGRAIDLQADLMRYTVDVTAGLAFGADINTLESRNEVIQSHLDKL